MRSYRKHHRWFIVITFLIAMGLDILPLPEWVTWFRPTWSILVLIYWILDFPYVIGVGYAFLLGIILDLLNGTLLGEHAIATVVLAYIILKTYQLIRMYTLIQQALIVALMLFSYQLIIFILQGLSGQSPDGWLYWAPVVSSALLWPWMFILLRDWCQRLNIE